MVEYCTNKHFLRIWKYPTIWQLSKPILDAISLIVPVRALNKINAFSLRPARKVEVRGVAAKGKARTVFGKWSPSGASLYPVSLITDDQTYLLTINTWQLFFYFLCCWQRIWSVLWSTGTWVIKHDLKNGWWRIPPGLRARFPRTIPIISTSEIHEDIFLIFFLCAIFLSQYWP
jgi:hypothetical protein